MTLSSSVQLYASGSDMKVHRFGHVVQLVGTVSPKAELASGAILTIGTVPAGYRPIKETLALCQTTGQKIFLLRVYENGTVIAERVRNGDTASTLSAGAWMPCYMTYMVS